MRRKISDHTKHFIHVPHVIFFFHVLCCKNLTIAYYFSWDSEKQTAMLENHLDKDLFFYQFDKFHHRMLKCFLTLIHRVFSSLSLKIYFRFVNKAHLVIKKREKRQKKSVTHWISNCFGVRIELSLQISELQYATQVARYFSL